jgi:hypothetical protein
MVLVDGDGFQEVFARETGPGYALQLLELHPIQTHSMAGINLTSGPPDRQPVVARRREGQVRRAIARREYDSIPRRRRGFALHHPGRGRPRGRRH